jgi:hypothetical protein
MIILEKGISLMIWVKGYFEGPQDKAEEPTDSGDSEGNDCADYGNNRKPFKEKEYSTTHPFSEEVIPQEEEID